VRVFATITETPFDNDDGVEVDGVIATCSRCEHTTESFGTSGASVRRCLVLLREECPRRETNYYEAGDQDDAE
jgi:hypothetical protein